MTRFDVQELMELRGGPGGAGQSEELKLAFRYLKRPFELKLRSGEVVAKTSAEVLTLALPVLQALGVRKEGGFLAVVTRASVRIKPAEGQMIGLDDIGASDLPPEMLKRAGDVALAFNYFSQPWRSADDLPEGRRPRATRVPWASAGPPPT